MVSWSTFIRTTALGLVALFVQSFTLAWEGGFSRSAAEDLEVDGDVGGVLGGFGLLGGCGLLGGSGGVVEHALIA